MSEAGEREGQLQPAERLLRHQEGLPDHKSWGAYGQVPRVQGRIWEIMVMGAGGDSRPEGWHSFPAENVPVPILFLRCCLHPQWR